MKEAIGNTFVFNVVIVFVGVISLLLVSSLAYSKAFKVKNRIVDIIEENRGYTSKATSEIQTMLKDMGYPIRRNGFSCPMVNGKSNISTSNYKYCVYMNSTAKGDYYTVTSYIVFDFPIIGQVLSFPVSGETKILYNIVG